MKLSLKYQFKYSLILMLLVLLCCNTKHETKQEKKSLLPLLITAKYCYNDVYPESYYFPGSDTIGVNIYFAGNITNNTSDTIYIPNKAMEFNDPLVDPLEESLFFSVINGDTLFFLEYYPSPVISPNGFATIELQRHITPKEVKWMKIFKDIGKNQEVLDTMRIYYATPNLKLDKVGKLLSPITFERSAKFRVDTSEHNSYFEHIFHRQDFYEEKLKEFIDDE